MLYDLFSDFFADFDSDLNFIINAPKSAVENRACPNCKMSLAQFAKTGKLGCSNCYDAFRPYLVGVLENIHGKSEHTGKISENADKKLKLQREIEKAEKELKEAIGLQNFEKAALLRDKIKEMKDKEAN